MAGRTWQVIWEQWGAGDCSRGETRSDEWPQLQTCKTSCALKDTKVGRIKEERETGINTGIVHRSEEKTRFHK